MVQYPYKSGQTLGVLMDSTASSLQLSPIFPADSAITREHSFLTLTGCAISFSSCFFCLAASVCFPFRGTSSSSSLSPIFSGIQCVHINLSRLYLACMRFNWRLGVMMNVVVVAGVGVAILAGAYIVWGSDQLFRRKGTARNMLTKCAFYI